MISPTQKTLSFLIVLVVWVSLVSPCTLYATTNANLSALSSSITTTTPDSWNDLIDTTLVDAVDQQSNVDLMKDLQQSKDSLKLTSAKSCEDFDEVLTKWLNKNKDFFTNQWWWFYYGRPMPIDWIATMESKTTVSDAAAPTANTVSMARESWWGWSPDHSTTNVQKEGIDEPDIIKNDGQYIYYVNNTKKLLSIIKWPSMSSWSLDVSTANVIKMIKLPKSYQTSDLLINGNKLILVARRYVNFNTDFNSSFYDRTSKTSVVVFDTTVKNKPTVVRLLDYVGNLQDARLVGDKLYVVSNLYFNRWPIYWALSQKKTLDSVITPQSLMPTGVEAIKKSNGKLDKHVTKPNCSTIQYILPEKITNFSPNVWLIYAIDIVWDAAATTSMFYGNAGQIHVTDKSIYTVSPVQLWDYNYSYPCPMNAKCAMPMIWRMPDNFSLIHKYALAGGKPSYTESALVKGDLLNQYSMDEDLQGNFRIITRNWNPQLATHIWKLDNKLQHHSQLLDVEPGEEFKASRYIGDKLYLVTFQQIDPLFVIDMKDKPTILWELKIPWFSQYLHPYAPLSNNKQLLLGLWVDTKTTTDGRTTTNGLKLDLYEVDYSLKTSTGSISIKQIQTKTVWGKWSYSEALDNPRVFVRNDSKKQLILPIITQDEIETKVCNKDYYGQEYCYPNITYNTTFAGRKTFSVDPSAITELQSKDYKDQIISYLKTNNTYYSYGGNALDQRQYMNLGNRVWYIGDITFFINNAFADFQSTTQGKVIKF